MRSTLSKPQSSPQIATLPTLRRSTIAGRYVAAAGVLMLSLILLAGFALPPFLAASHIRAATAILERGDRNRLHLAAAELEQAARILPNDPEAYRQLALVAQLRERPVEQVAALQAAAQRAPRSLQIRYELAQAYEALGDYAQAARVWHDVGIPSAEAQARGVEAQARGDTEAAITWYRRAFDLAAIEEAPLASGRWMLDQVLAAEPGSEAAAERMLELGTFVAADYRPFWYERGRNALDNGDWQTALELFQTAASTGMAGNVGLSNVYHMIGRIQQYQAEPRDPQAAWQSYALALESADFRRDRWQIAETYHQRATLLAQQGEWASMLREEELALAANPEHYFANVGSAIALNRLGRAADALPFAARAMELEPDRYEGYLQFADAAAATGDMQAAGDAYRRVLALNGRVEAARIALERLESQP